MKYLVCLLTGVLLSAAAIPSLGQKNRPDTVAGIPVNYEEENVGRFSLPDPLKLSNGKRVTSSEDWWQKRRPEILKMFEEQQFGKVPPKPSDVSFFVFDKGTQVLEGKALRKQVRIYFGTDTASALKTDVVIYLPASISGPSPLLLNVSFSTNDRLFDDPGIQAGSVWSKEGARIKPPERPFPKLDIEQFISAGFGIASLCYTDIEPDMPEGLKYGIRSKYLKDGAAGPAADEWGAISAWSWCLSRVMDYFEVDEQIDAKRIALTGASRLGKTVLWTGARDARFAVIIPSISGEGGAALSRRNYGETIAHLVAPTRYPYQFAANYARFASNPDVMPFDSHMLIALVAPRPLLLQTGNTDYWSDPKGEYLAALAAAPVYRLFGKTGPSITQMPPAGDRSNLMHTLGYFMHDGGHTVLPEDWKLFIEYLSKHL